MFNRLSTTGNSSETLQRHASLNRSQEKPVLRIDCRERITSSSSVRSSNWSPLEVKNSNGVSSTVMRYVELVLFSNFASTESIKTKRATVNSQTFVTLSKSL